ncbi:formylglycine-generating enzyme family protein [Aestuariirhabdus litorea]|uniref:Formylglycine-generating enzyme family protein n=1 Tax=Aestuariirhabdus litorea TaxID=2528527 RepID=A0A3P3VP94_9GAMM|nr:formylglycine-generating enzyme family protein [Aestuariirhabdus litorea]RRJ84234.1 formylglycine-generating enzyme family protein [Aestuariirhabdus litorea]RWW97456.1 formylglycine-generating enzyme family protein [Endozoicomonadaceae bacterium GTF-13]
MRVCLLLLLVLSWPLSAAERYTPYPFRDLLVNGQSCSSCPQMVRLPAGRFYMGAFPGDGHSDERGPGGVPFEVRITQVVAMSVSEVSREEYSAFIEANPQRASSGCGGFVAGTFAAQIEQGWRFPGFEQTADHPVVCVSWEDAQAYARWLSAITGKRYRLPTEAEWEYGARAGSITRYWWGNHMASERVNCGRPQCDIEFPATAPAHALDRNGFGLYHTLGNVWEWVEDCYQADAYALFSSQYPRAVAGDAQCKRVIRGGSWNEGYWSLRASNREGWLPSRPLNDIGFRVVREGDEMPI